MNEDVWSAMHKDPRHLLRYPSEVVVRFLASRPKGKVLDVGAGAGRHMRVALEMGHEVTGCDISENALERAKNLVGTYSGVTYTQCPMTNLPYPDGAFDTVVAWHSCYYGTTLEVSEALSELRRVLKPGGAALIGLRTVDDRRYGAGENTGYHTYRLNTDETGESGLLVTFLDTNNVTLLMRKWSNVVYDRSDVTRNMQLDSDWHLTATK